MCGAITGDVDGDVPAAIATDVRETVPAQHRAILIVTVHV